MSNSRPVAEPHETQAGGRARNRFGLVFLVLVAGALTVLSFNPDSLGPRYSHFVVPGLIVGLISTVLLHLFTLRRAKAQQRKADDAFATADREFSSLFRNTLDAILILDDRGVCLDANPSAFTILGTSAGQLIGQPLSKFYADARAFECDWSVPQQLRRRGHATLVRGDGAMVFVEYTCAHNCAPGHHLLVLCDTTPRKQAENSLRRSEERAHQMADHAEAHVVAADAARAETDALRKSTFVLTQNLAMDTVLDTLLECLSDLVPYSAASVLLVEDFSHVFVARAAPKIAAKRHVVTLAAADQPLLQTILLERKSIFVPDTGEEKEWRNHRAFAGMRCWFGVPLVASDHVLGVLSVGSNAARKFTREHFRLAKSLAIPAAAAIQNARLCERVEIYAAELQLRLNDLRGTQDTNGEPSG